VSADPAYRLWCRHAERSQSCDLLGMTGQNFDEAYRRVARRRAAAFILLESPLAATDDDAGLFLGQAQLLRTVLMRAA
jgi:hypothetical protein